MQSDPIGLDGGENSFVYVGDNPLVMVDESGYNWADKFAKALISYAKRKVDILLSKARYIDKYSNKKYAVYDKDGNFEDVIKDFKDLPVANVRVTRNSDGMTVYIGDLDDGRRVIARSGSGERSGIYQL